MLRLDRRNGSLNYYVQLAGQEIDKQLSTVNPLLGQTSIDLHRCPGILSPFQPSADDFNNLFSAFYEFRGQTRQVNDSRDAGQNWLTRLYSSMEVITKECSLRVAIAYAEEFSQINNCYGVLFKPMYHSNDGQKEGCVDVKNLFHPFILFDTSLESINTVGTCYIYLLKDNSFFDMEEEYGVAKNLLRPPYDCLGRLYDATVVNWLISNAYGQSRRNDVSVSCTIERNFPDLIDMTKHNLQSLKETLINEKIVVKGRTYLDTKLQYLVGTGILHKNYILPYYGTAALQFNRSMKLVPVPLSPFGGINMTNNMLNMASDVNADNPAFRAGSVCTGSRQNMSRLGLLSLYCGNLNSPLESYPLYTGYVSWLNICKRKATKRLKEIKEENYYGINEQKYRSGNYFYEEYSFEPRTEIQNCGLPEQEQLSDSVVDAEVATEPVF